MAAPPGLDRRRFLYVLGATLPVLGGVPLLFQRPSPASRGRVASAEEWLIAAIQDGGKVIYLRHAATVHTQIDTGRLDNRDGQRNLSPEGMLQAERLGMALRALRVPLNRILTSPVFRARDTADLSFGVDTSEVTMDLVADDYAGDRLRSMLEGTKRLLETPPPPGENLVLVGHRTPLEMVTGRAFPDSILPEGAMAVFLPGSAAHLLGTITAEQVVASAVARGALDQERL